MTRKETVFLLLAALVAVALTTGVAEWRRRTLPDRPPPPVPADVADPPETGPDGRPVLDAYGRPRPARKLRITWMGQPSAYGMPPGAWVERGLEARFNVELEPVILDYFQYGRKRPLMFCGGTIPDVSWIADPINVQREAEQGFFVEVPFALLNRHAPAIVRQINTYAPHAWGYALHRGRLYGLPTLYFEGRNPRPGLWRADWLRRVGLVERDAEGRVRTGPEGRPLPAVPVTLDEMEEALRRFREDDPDGNGRRDTYGMSADISSSWWTTFGEVFGAYGVMPFDWQYDPDTGELTFGGITAAALRVIRRLRAWREAELIDPDFLGDRMNADVPRKFRNGRTGYIGYYTYWYLVDPANPNSLRHEMKRFDPGAELAVSTPPVGPPAERRFDIQTGAPLPPGGRYRGTRTWSAGGNTLCFGRYTADDPARIVRILTILNTMVEETDAVFASPDPAAMLPTDPAAPIFGPEWSIGRRRMHWEFADPARGFDGVGVLSIPPFDQKVARDREGIGLSFYRLYTGEPGNTLKTLGPEARAYMRTYRNPEWATSDLFGKPDVLPSAGRLLAPLRSFQLLQYSRMIRSSTQGGVPPEALDEAFASFAAEWRRLGGETLLAEARKLKSELTAFQRRHGIPTERPAP